MFNIKQKIILGFEIDSCSMTITLTKDITGYKQLVTPHKIYQRKLAFFIGNIVGRFTAVSFGSLYYRSLKKDKLEALKISKFNYDTYLTLLDNSITELQWCDNNIEQA